LNKFEKFAPQRTQNKAGKMESRFLAGQYFFNPIQNLKSKITMKLLIVEDNAGMRRLIKSIVSYLADEVIECEDGAEALTAYTNFHPDWVLMDIKMPKMDGLTTTLTIKNYFPDANICIVTDYGDQKTINAAFEAGAKGYILKENLHSLRDILLANI
jgi:CheY-like chemotaxis protein